MSDHAEGEGGRVPWSGSDHAGRGHIVGQIMQGEDT